jgi:hypothetical protein
MTYEPRNPAGLVVQVVLLWLVQVHGLERIGERYISPTLFARLSGPNAMADRADWRVQSVQAAVGVERLMSFDIDRSIREDRRGRWSERHVPGLISAGVHEKGTYLVCTP